MADQQAPIPEGADTPAAAGPEGSGAAEQAEVDWSKRYHDLQPEYTRSTQRVRELEDRERWFEMALTSEDADTRRQAVEALGYTLEEDEEGLSSEPADYEDPYVALLARQERVEQQLAEREQAEREAQENALIKAHTDERLAALEGLDQEDQDWVLAYAINALPAVRDPNVPVPLPDIAGAFEAFTARETERQKRWAQTKRAPYVSPGGTTATEVPDLDSHQGRVDYALRQLNANQEA
jgi:hypothetical protein